VISIKIYRPVLMTKDLSIPMCENFDGFLTLLPDTQGPV